MSKRENPAISAGEIVEDRRKREIRQLFGPLSAGCVPLHFRGRSSRISTAHWLEQCYVRRPAAPASPRTSVKPAIGQTGGGVGDTRPSKPFCVDCDWLLADRGRGPIRESARSSASQFQPMGRAPRELPGQVCQIDRVFSLERSLTALVLLTVVKHTQTDHPLIGGLAGQSGMRAGADMGSLDRETLASRNRTLMLPDPCAVRRAAARGSNRLRPRYSPRELHVRHAQAPQATLPQAEALWRTFSAFSQRRASSGVSHKLSRAAAHAGL